MITRGKPDGIAGTHGLTDLFTLEYWSLSLVWWETMKNFEVRGDVIQSMRLRTQPPCCVLKSKSEESADEAKRPIWKSLQ